MAPNSMNAYQTYLEWIPQQYQTMISLIEKWASINSWSDHFDGLQNMLRALEEDFQILNGDQETYPLPPRAVIDDLGNRLEKPSSQALSIRKRPKAPLQVLLVGHSDTVYPPHIPYPIKRQGDVLKGPGVTDMKGGLAIMLKALQAFERSPFADKIGWQILINPDEEIGSPGSRILLSQLAKQHHLGLIFEPSYSDGAFVSARKGSSNFTLLIKGKAAHAGRDFHLGRNAIYALAHFIHEIEKIQTNYTSATINVGKIGGGGPTNIVPDFAMCSLNMRAHTLEDMLDMKKDVDALIEICQSREGIQAILIEDSFRSPKPFDVKTQALFQSIQQCAEQLHLDFQLRESGGVCDGNILAAAGLPTFDTLGPIGGHIHTPEEYLNLPSLIDRTRLVALFLMKLANGEIKT